MLDFTLSTSKPNPISTQVIDLTSRNLEREAKLCTLPKHRVQNWTVLPWDKAVEVKRLRTKICAVEMLYTQTCYGVRKNLLP